MMRENTAATPSHDHVASVTKGAPAFLLAFGLLVVGLLLTGCSKPKTFAPGIDSETIGSSVVDSEIRWRKEFPERFFLNGALRRLATRDQWSATFQLSVGHYSKDPHPNADESVGPGEYRKSFRPPSVCTVVTCRGDSEEAVAQRELKWGCFSFSIREEHYTEVVTFTLELLEPSGHIKLYFRNKVGELWFVLEAPLGDLATLPTPE